MADVEQGLSPGQTEMTNRHCNKAHVWGTLEKYQQKTTEGAGKPYLEVFIDCEHAEYGNVRCLGFIWGAENVTYFKKDYKRGAEVRLSGGIQQYKGRGDATRTTFNFYLIKPGPIKEKKAAFIIVGEVVSYEDERLTIRIKIPPGNSGGTEYPSREETLTVRLPHEIILAGEENDYPDPGKLISVKGYLMQEEDEFGDATGPQQPVVKELKYLSVDKELEGG